MSSKAAVRAMPAEKPHKAAGPALIQRQSVAIGVVASAIYRQKSILHGFYEAFVDIPDLEAPCVKIEFNYYLY